MEHKVCSQHSGIKTALDSIASNQQEIKRDIKEINNKLERVPVLWEFHDTTRKMVYGAYGAIMVIVGWLLFLMKG